MDEESRDRLRIDLGKLAFAKMGDIAHGGLLKDISASGVAIEFVLPMGKVENPFKHGDYIEIEIDEIGSLKGTITSGLRQSEESGLSDPTTSAIARLYAGSLCRRN